MGIKARTIVPEINKNTTRREHIANGTANENLNRISVNKLETIKKISQIY
jgi:hypothetical protein